MNLHILLIVCWTESCGPMKSRADLGCGVIPSWNDDVFILNTELFWYLHHYYTILDVDVSKQIGVIFMLLILCHKGLIKVKLPLLLWWKHKMAKMPIIMPNSCITITLMALAICTTSRMIMILGNAQIGPESAYLCFHRKRIGGIHFTHQSSCGSSIIELLYGYLFSWEMVIYEWWNLEQLWLLPANQGISYKSSA